MSDDQHLAHNLQRKVLHSKRSFASRHKSADSQLYDASEEDNTDDASSAISIPVGNSTPHGSTRQLPTSPLAQSKSTTAGSTSRTTGGSGSNITGLSAHRATTTSGGTAAGRDTRLDLESDEGVDSPTYDGDIESSTTAAPANHPGSSVRYLGSPSTLGPNSPLLSTSSIMSAYPPSISESSASTNDGLSPAPLTAAPQSVLPKATPRATESQLPFFENEGMQLAQQNTRLTYGEGVEVHTDKLTAEEIQSFVKAAIEGTDGSPRKYKINPPPKGRPVRIYADGVYDLFHFGHALQLRQAKLSFPSVYTLVGVNSDELCEQHKSRTVMSHEERCESARHCKWVDKVVPEAPWVLDEAFLNKYNIDYVAHDEDPYKGSDGSEDVYSLVKKLGKFLPTRRTPGVSTSDLIERLVRGYRNRDWDQKLDKIGHPELRAEGSEYDGSRPTSPSKRSQPDDQHPESLKMTKIS